MKEPVKWKAGDVVQIGESQTVLLFLDGVKTLGNIMIGSCSIGEDACRKGALRGFSLIDWLNSEGKLLFNIHEQFKNAGVPNVR